MVQSTGAAGELEEGRGAAAPRGGQRHGRSLKLDIPSNAYSVGTLRHAAANLYADLQNGAAMPSLDRLTEVLLHHVQRAQAEPAATQVEATQPGTPSILQPHPNASWDNAGVQSDQSEMGD